MLQGAILLGPRFDRIKDGKFITIHGHDKLMGFIGASCRIAVGTRCDATDCQRRRDRVVGGMVCLQLLVCISIAG